MLIMLVTESSSKSGGTGRAARRAGPPEKMAITIKYCFAAAMVEQYFARICICILCSIVMPFACPRHTLHVAEPSTVKGVITIPMCQLPFICWPSVNPMKNCH